MKTLFAVVSGLLLLASPAAKAGGDIDPARQLTMIYERALAAVDRGLESSPDAAPLHLLKGQILIEQGRTGEASATFQKLTAEYPELADPYQRLALLYSAEGQYDKSRAALHKSFLPLSTARQGTGFDTPRSGSTQ